jgi:Right handed beta helix region
VTALAGGIRGGLILPDAMTFPGPGTAPLSVPVGYTNAAGYTGSLTTWSSPISSLVPGTTYSQYFFPTGAYGIVSSNVTFIGCLFEANRVTDANTAGVFATPCSNIRFSYCTFQPSAVSTWPVTYANGYQYGIDQRGISGLTIDHCEIWGYGNAIELSTSSQASPVTITWNWIHDPRADGGVDHTDGILCNDGISNMYLTVANNTIASVGNTNGLALQYASSPYSYVTVIRNYFSGYGYMTNVGGNSASTNVTFTDNVWGADFEPVYGPLYGSTFVSQTGCTWLRNRIYVPSASPLYGASASWMAAGNSSLYWWPTDTLPSGPSQIIGHAADY